MNIETAGTLIEFEVAVLQKLNESKEMSASFVRHSNSL